MFPDFQLEFDLPESGSREEGINIRSTCNVTYCRRLSKDSYHLGLNFVDLSQTDARLVADYINSKSAKPLIH